MKCELSCCMDVQEPRLTDVTRVVVELVGFLKDHGVRDETFLAEFQLAAAEAINNAVEHGCAEAENAFFHARLYLRPDHVELRVQDPSAFEGWQSEARLPDDPFDEGGRGHFILSQMADELHHEREDGMHVLVFRKSFRETSWDYIPGEVETTLASMTEELCASYEMTNTLIGLGEWLASAPGMDAFMNGALDRLCEITGAEAAYVRFERAGQLVLGCQSGTPPRKPVEKLTIDQFGVEMDVLRTGDELTLPMDSSLPADDPLHGMFSSVFVTPVLFKEKRIGTLVLGRTVPSPFFNAGQLKVARVVAEYLGITLTMSELQKKRGAEERALRDLEIAAEIQLSLMPHSFEGVPGLDLFGTCKPAQKAGGDYFDVLVMPDDSVLAVVADVMGKGLPAAILATMLRTNLHASMSHAKDPGVLLEEINRLMIADLSKLEMFITVALIWISPDRRTLCHASAGHPSSILRSVSGDCVELGGHGIPIGILPESTYSAETFSLDPGSLVVMYTDGIAEAMNPGGEMFEAPGILRVLAESSSESSKQISHRILDAVEEFSEHAPPTDDRTIITLRRTI